LGIDLVVTKRALGFVAWIADFVKKVCCLVRIRVVVVVVVSERIEGFLGSIVIVATKWIVIGTEGFIIDLVAIALILCLIITFLSGAAKWIFIAFIRERVVSAFIREWVATKWIVVLWVVGIVVVDKGIGFILVIISVATKWITTNANGFVVNVFDIGIAKYIALIGI